jgi:PAS domain S-box-containing protein
MLVIDPETGAIADANPAACAFYGYSREEITKKKISEINQLPRERVAAAIQMAIAGESRHFYFRHRLASGEVRDVEVYSGPVQVGDKQFLYSIVHDMTERRQAEAALLESEERFRTLADTAPFCILEVDMSHTPPTVLWANRRAEEFYGATSHVFPANIVEAIIPADAIQAGKPLTIETFHTRRGKSRIPVRVRAISEPAPAQNRVIITVEDIATEMSRRSEEQALAEERRRIAHEIHDGLAQDLAALRVRVALWHDLVDQDPTRMHVELDALQNLLSKNIRDVRRSIFALRPLALEEMGFLPALRQFIAEFGEQNQLHVDLTILGPEDRIPSALEPMLFRIIQEALNNVARHAQAEMAWVEMDLQAPDSLSLEVRDNGVGFSTAILDQAIRQGHLGLAQMRERVHAGNGTLLVNSQPGTGTVVRVVLPVKAERKT